MPKACKPSVSIADVSSLPLVLDVDGAADLLGLRPKYVRAHAEDLGGVKHAGVWKFGTSKLLRAFGAEV